MKRFLFFLSFIVAISFEVNAQSKSSFTLSQFSFEDTSGKKFSLDSLKGKTVYVDCWYPGCPPCRAEMPYAQLLQKRLHKMQMDSNIVFVTISFKQSKEIWLNALHTLPMPSAIHLYSPAGTYEQTFTKHSFPTYRIFNAKGELDNEICPLPSEIGFIDFVLFATQRGLTIKQAMKIVLSQKEVTKSKLALIKNPLLKEFWTKYFDHLLEFQKDIDALRKTK